MSQHENGLDLLVGDENGDTVPVFTIGYSTGEDQNQKLDQIADRTRAKFFKGTPENIREVFKSISTFF